MNVVDAKEFLKTVTPAAQRSRLAPYWNEINMLREKGYSLEQVCQFLLLNDVEISIAGLSKYIKRREKKEGKDSGTSSPKSAEPASSPQGGNDVPEAQGLGEVLDAKKQEEKTAQYIKPHANSLADRKKKQE